MKHQFVNVTNKKKSNHSKTENIYIKKIVEPHQSQNFSETNAPLFLLHSTDFSNCASSVQRQAVEDENDHELVQTKLNIGDPNDRYEQEANCVADTILRMPVSQ